VNRMPGYGSSGPGDQDGARRNRRDDRAGQGDRLGTRSWARRTTPPCASGEHVDEVRSLPVVRVRVLPPQRCPRRLSSGGPKKGEGAGPSPQVSSPRRTSRTAGTFNRRGPGSFDHGKTRQGTQNAFFRDRSVRPVRCGLRAFDANRSSGHQRRCRLTRIQLLSRVSNNRLEELTRTGRRRQRAYLDI
jgi:hypothetical protein